MSLRHLKRLKQLNNISSQADEEDEVDVLPAPKNKSIFQMLVAQEESLAEEQENSSDVDDREAGNEEAKNLGARKKTRNRAKNKKKKSAASSRVNDDIERKLQYIEDENQAPKPVVEQNPDEEATIESALGIQLKLLKYEHEVYKKFGSEALRGEGGGPRFGPRIANRSILVRDAGSHYAGMQGRRVGGVTMKPAAQANYFEYCFSPDYWQVQAEFTFVVDYGDSDALFEMYLERVSDHVDLLIQISDMLREEGEIPRAADSIERALYILEKAFHPSFNLQSGQCRLHYPYKPNRALFIVLFLHAYHISLKGCSRTALEIAKAILSLDPVHDPLAVLLVIDNYAIRAREYKWLINFFDVMQKDNRHLEGFPNMAYSVALAYFHLKDYAKADEMLRAALLRFPEVVKAIADKNSVMMDKKSAGVFDKIFPENLLVDLYAERCGHLFREPSVMEWTAKACVEIASSQCRPAVPTVPTYRRNILRHISLSHVPGVKLQPKHVVHYEESVYGFDPFPPPTSHGDLTPRLSEPDLEVFDGLPEATINNFLNSFNPSWTGQGDDQNVGSSLRRGVGSLVEAVVDLMGNIIDTRTEANDAQNAEAAEPARNEQQDEAQE